MKETRIVKYNGELGLLIRGSYERKDKLLFLPPKIGMHSEKYLDVVTETQVTEATLLEKVEYLKQNFVWGNVIGSEVINMGEYVILSYKDNENNILYHTYINFSDTHRSYLSVDSALIGLLDYKYQGVNSQAAIHIERILEMNNKQV